MEVKHILLLTEADDPTEAEPVVVNLEADTSCLLITVVKGEKKADVFLWRGRDGSVWGRVSSHLDVQNGDDAKEIDLFPDGKHVQSQKVFPPDTPKAEEKMDGVALAAGDEDDIPLPHPPEEIPEGEEEEF